MAGDDGEKQMRRQHGGSEFNLFDERRHGRNGAAAEVVEHLVEMSLAMAQRPESVARKQALHAETGESLRALAIVADLRAGRVEQLDEAAPEHGVSAE